MKGFDGQQLRFIFASKWRLAILRELAIQPMRLSDLEGAIPECSKKMLIDNLHALEKEAWITRHDYSKRLRWVEYVLQPAFVEAVGNLDVIDS